MTRLDALKSLAAERSAYVAFIDLKRGVGDYKQVVDYAEKILLCDEKIQLLNSISEVSNAQDAATLVKNEAQAIVDKIAQRAQENQS